MYLQRYSLFIGYKSALSFDIFISIDTLLLGGSSEFRAAAEGPPVDFVENIHVAPLYYASGE